MCKVVTILGAVKDLETRRENKHVLLWNGCLLTFNLVPPGIFQAFLEPETVN